MKTLLIPNLNNKLSCNYFSHIGFSPDQKIPESELKQKYIIEDQNKEIENFEAELVTFARCPIGFLSEMDTYMANGVDKDKFMMDFKLEHPEVHEETEIAIYIYRRVCYLGFLN